MNNDNSILWRRLDTPGHDACGLEKHATGWRLVGTAVFLHQGMPACFEYRIACNARWQTQRGYVRGWLGKETIEFRIVRTAGGVWSLNGAIVSGLDVCIDVDLGFTPATNLLPVRRLALDPGQAAEAPAAWLDVNAHTLEILPQRYERRYGSTYWYEAPDFGYAALLEVTSAGFVRRYPDLWEAEI